MSKVSNGQRRILMLGLLLNSAVALSELLLIYSQQGRVQWGAKFTRIH